MKSFLITVTILGAIIYGMLQINAYYDDRGACSWGLFSGGHYYHKERLDKAIEGLIKDIIKQDKNARRTLMQQQGKNEAEVNKTLKALDPQYKIEREKMQKYCYLDFEKEPYFQKYSMRVKPSSYCEIGNGNNSGDSGYTGLRIEYKFDKESLEFFNEVSYIAQRRDKSYYLTNFSGIKYGTGYHPCETRYQGLGETGHLFGKKIRDVFKFDKTKHVKF